MPRIVSFLFLLTLLLAAPLAAQVPPAAPQDTLLPVADTIPREGPLPRAAFVRGLILPGWGHFGMGEYRRGAVYFTLHSASWAMLAKTLLGLADARDTERTVAGLARDSVELLIQTDTVLREQIRDDPAAYDAELIRAYPELAQHRALVTARERHRQDWIVYTVVVTFASAIDAYVTAHLADFPADVTTGRSRDGGTSIGMRIPVGGKR